MKKRKPYKIKKRIKKFDVYGLVSQVGTFKKKLTKLVSLESEGMEHATRVGQNYAKMMGQTFSHIQEDEQ